jgi:hypothetical protein
LMQKRLLAEEHAGGLALIGEWSCWGIKITVVF